jgi:hypothetical protein
MKEDIRKKCESPRKWDDEKGERRGQREKKVEEMGIQEW